MNILQEVFSKQKATEVLKAVAEMPLEKLAASAIGATVFDLAAIYALLMLLIIIDIFTACIYQSSLLWKKMYDPKIVAARGTLFNYIRWIWSAHHWRFVDSFALRDGFFSKMTAYGLLIIGAFGMDLILGIRHVPQYALTICTGILACTEYLSICENLDAAGVKIGGQIRDLIQKRKEQIK